MIVWIPVFIVGFAVGYGVAYSVERRKCVHDWHRIRLIRERWANNDLCGEIEVYQCSKCNKVKRKRLW